jgi:hypothetical protein
MNATDELHDGPAAAEPRAAARPHVPPPYPAAAARYPREKSVPLASLLSLMPGLGQVYVGYYQRGFVHAIVVAVLISVLAEGQEEVYTPMLGMFLTFFWLYNIVDAGRRASLYNQALAGTETIELPRDFQLPGARGSLWGGLVLIGAGAMLLSNTRFGYSLDWVGEWWPVAPILLGVWLLVRAIQDRRGA